MSEQQGLFSVRTSMHGMVRFGGPDVTIEDEKRLTGQLQRVHGLMSDHQWRTLAEIAEAVSGSEAGVSARLRDLRRPEYGKHTVERRRRSKGLYEYRIQP